MPNFLFSPGPTHLPDEVRQKLAIEPPHHRSEAFRSFFVPALHSLKRLFQTQGEVAVLTCSGSGAMEAAVVNFTSPGDEVLVIEGGKFGRRWVDICRRFSCRVTVLSLPMGQICDLEELTKYIVSAKNFKAVFLTQTETSSGSLFDIPKMIALIKDHSDAAIIVDVVASLAADTFYQDEWAVDAAVGCSQKGLMCPPGLGLVSVSPEGRKKLKKPPGLYWDLQLYFDYHRKGQTPFTPAINLIWALSAALEMLEKQGLEEIWREKSCLAQAFREAIKSAGWEIFPMCSSSALTVFKLPQEVKDKQVILELEKSTGFRISGGLEEISGTVLRISHMGAIGYEDLTRLIPPLFRAIDKKIQQEKIETVLAAFTGAYKSL